MWGESWFARKDRRREEFMRNHGRKLIRCSACNGSGFYDHNGSPPCSSCNGTGREQEQATGKGQEGTGRA